MDEYKVKCLAFGRCAWENAKKSPFFVFPVILALPPFAVIFLQKFPYFLSFSEKRTRQTRSAWHPGSKDPPFPQPWMPKAQWFLTLKALNMFNNFQQKTAATKHQDEVTEIFKTQGIEIQLVSGRVKVFSSWKEAGWLSVPNHTPNWSQHSCEHFVQSLWSLANGQPINVLRVVWNFSPYLCQRFVHIVHHQY